jgi:SAM-dependent methyltransferase
MLTQAEQDRIWRHHQDRVTKAFDLSYPRLRYLAERCKPGTRVLNVGVGTGYLEALLMNRAVEVFSLDPSAESIERLRRELGMGDRAKTGYSQDIPFEAERFDKVIMTEVLEHLQTDVLHATVDEVRRVLRPGGEFSGTVPYREDLTSNGVVCPRCDAQFHRWGHEQTFDIGALVRLLEGHGLRIRRVYPRAFPDFRRRNVKLLMNAAARYLLGRLGEPLVGPNLYFRATKI